MFSRLSLVSWNEPVGESDRAGLKARLAGLSPGPGALLADDLPPNRNGGDLLWRVNFASREAHDAWVAGGAERDGAFLRDHPLAAHVDQVACESLRTGEEHPGTAGGLYRVLALAVVPGAPAEAVAAFEREMMAMPAYIGTILRWNFARVVASSGSRRFTHVWEQEYVDLGGFRGEYMNHPFHWGHLDRWFDADNPARIVDTHLCNSFCPIDRPVLFATA